MVSPQETALPRWGPRAGSGSRMLSLWLAGLIWPSVSSSSGERTHQVSEFPLALAKQPPNNRRAAPQILVSPRRSHDSPRILPPTPPVWTCSSPAQELESPGAQCQTLAYVACAYNSDGPSRPLFTEHSRCRALASKGACHPLSPPRVRAPVGWRSESSLHGRWN